LQPSVADFVPLRDRKSRKQRGGQPRCGRTGRDATCKPTKKGPPGPTMCSAPWRPARSPRAAPTPPFAAPSWTSPPSGSGGRRPSRWDSAARRRRRLSLVVEDRAQPALGGLQVPALAARVVGDLVLLDPADAEVVALGVGEVEAGDRRGRVHGEALGEVQPGRGLSVQQLEERGL